MKLFTMGPVAMYPHTLEVAQKQIPYFRTQEFSEIMLESESLLKKFVGAGEQDQIAFLTASGTAAMEAVVINCFSKNDKLLIIDGGTFGHRFVEICQAYGIPYEAVRLTFEETLQEKHLIPHEGKGYTGLLVNLHETSTGQLYNCQMLSEFCQRNNCYFIVDAIGTFLAEHFDMNHFKIDVAILSSQKGLALAPGMAFVVIGEKIFCERISISRYAGLYLNLKDHLHNQRRGQTPFTPAVRVALELNDMLKHLQEETLERRLEELQTLVKYFRERVTSLGIRFPETPLSYAETPLIIETADATKDIYLPLKEQYQIILTPCGGELSSKLVRVGHFGYHTKNDYDELLDKLEIMLLHE